MNILEDYYSPVVLFPEHTYSASGVYHQIQPTYDLNVSTQHRIVQAGLLRLVSGVLLGEEQASCLPVAH